MYIYICIYTHIHTYHVHVCIDVNINAEVATHLMLKIREVHDAVALFRTWDRNVGNY